MKPSGLYSKRYSHARGWYWKHERDVFGSEAKAWLEVFRRDEPNVEFVVSLNPPKVK